MAASYRTSIHLTIEPMSFASEWPYVVVVVVIAKLDERRRLNKQ
jgi:hypothetical protein